MSLDSDYLMRAGGLEYGVTFMKPWILHTRLELYKAMVAQSWCVVFFRGTIWYLSEAPTLKNFWGGPNGNYHYICVGVCMYMCILFDK